MPGGLANLWEVVAPIKRSAGGVCKFFIGFEVLALSKLWSDGRNDPQVSLHVQAWLVQNTPHFHACSFIPSIINESMLHHDPQTLGRAFVGLFLGSKVKL